MRRQWQYYSQQHPQSPSNTSESSGDPTSSETSIIAAAAVAAATPRAPLAALPSSSMAIASWQSGWREGDWPAISPQADSASTAAACQNPYSALQQIQSAPVQHQQQQHYFQSRQTQPQHSMTQQFFASSSAIHPTNVGLQELYPSLLPLQQSLSQPQQLSSSLSHGAAINSSSSSSGNAFSSSMHRRTLSAQERGYSASRSHPYFSLSSMPSTSTMPMDLSRPSLTRGRSLRSEGDREEANRQKSKRHYDRKKEQRSAMAKIATETIQEVEQLQKDPSLVQNQSQIFQQVVQALAFRLPLPNELSESSRREEPSNATKRANERKRLNKLMQRHLEMQRIQQLSHIARALEPGARIESVNSLLQFSAKEVQEAGLLKDDVESRLMHALLQPWMRCREAWPHLLLAEERLSLIPGRPLARIVTSLRLVVEGNTREGASMKGDSSRIAQTSSLSRGN